MSNEFKKTSERKSIQFGKFGSVEVEEFNDIDVEVFAKYTSSVNGNGGPNYSDDCGMGGPCTAVTFMEM